MELCSPEPQDMISSSTSSVFVAQEPILPFCDYKKAKHSNHSTSSGSSCNNSSWSYLPVFSEGTTRKFRSHSLPILSKKQPSVFKNQGTSLPPFHLSKLRKSKLFQNLATLSPLRPQSSFINSVFKSSDFCKQQVKTKDERKSKNHLTSDHWPNSVIKKRPQFPGWAPIQLSLLAWWELETHMAWKVCTLQQQTVPLLVRESWAMLNYLIGVQGGVPEPQKPQIQLPMPVHQSTEQNINNTAPDLLSFQFHVNIGVGSELNRTETKASQSLIPGKQSQSGDCLQILGSKPLVTSMNTPPPKNLGVDIIQKETLLQKDPKHMVELNIEQRVIGLPVKSIQQHKTQVTNVELMSTPPHQVRDKIKVTPLALLQVMDSMGIIPESHSEVTESVGLFPQLNEVVKPMKTMETVSVSSKTAYQVTESVEVTSTPQHQVMESKKMTSRPQNQVTDNVKVTPVALLQAMNSMGMMKKSHPHIIESVGMTPKPQYQVKESVRMNTLLDHQVIQPRKMRPKPQYTVMETAEMTPGPQNKIVELVGTTSKTKSQVIEPLKDIPGSICQNTKSIALIPGPQLQAIEHVHLAPPQAFPDTKTVELTPRPLQEEIKSVELAPGYQETEAKLTSDTCHHDKESVGLIQPSLGDTPGPLSHASKSRQMNSVSSQGTPKSEIKSIKALGEIPVPPLKTQASLEFVSESEIQGMKSETLTPESQDMKFVNLNLGPYSEVTNHEELISEPQFQSMKSVPLTSEPQPQSIKLEELTLGPLMHVNKFVDLTVPLEQSRKLIPESQLLHVDCRRLTMEPHLQATKSVGLTSRSKHQDTVPTELVSEIWPQEEEAMKLIPQQTMETPGMRPRPHSENFSEMALEPSYQDTETVRLTSEALLQIAFTQKMTGQVTESAKMTLSPHLQVNELSKIPLTSEHENTETGELSLFQVENIQDAMPVLPHSEKGSLEFTLGPKVQYEKSEQLRQNMKPIKLTSESSPLVVGSKQFITEPKLHVMDLAPESQPTGVKSRQSDPEPQLQDMKYVNLIQQPTTIGVVESEKLQEPVLQSISENFTKGAQLQGLKLTVGPQLQSVRFSKLSPGPLLQGELPEDLISGPPHHDLKSDELTLGSSVQEIKLSDFILEPKHQSVTTVQLTPQPQPQGMKFVELNSVPCLQDIKFSDLTPEQKHQGFKHVQFMSGTKLQDLKSVGFTNPIESSLQLSQGLPVENMKSVLSTEGSQFHSMASVKLISETPFQGEKYEEMNLGPRQQDVKLSELTSGPKLQVVKLGEQTPGSMFHGVNSVVMTPQLGLQDLQLAKMSPGLQGMKQVGLSPRPWLQGVKFYDLTSGTQPQRVRSSELKSGPQLQYVKFLELTPEPKVQGVKSKDLTPAHEKQGVKSEMLVPEPLFQGVKCVEVISPEQQCVNSEQVERGSKSEDGMSLELIPELNIKDGKLVDFNVELHSKGMHSFELTPESNIQGVKSQEFKLEPQLQSIKPLKFTSGPQLHQVKPSVSTLGPHIQGVKTVELKQEPQLKSMRCIQWTPGPEFQGGKSIGLNLGSQSQGVKSVELKSFIQSRDVKSSEWTLGPKIQSATYMEFNPGPPLQSVKTPELPQGPQLQKGKFLASTSEPQLQGIKTMELNKEPQFGSMKSVQWMPAPEFQCVKSLLNLGLQSQWVKPAELKPLIQLRDKKSSIQRHQPQGGDLKPCLQFTSMKSCDLTSRFKSRLHLHDEKSPKLIRGPQLQEVKPLQSTAETQLRDVKSQMLTQGPQLPEVKSGELSQGSQLQSDKTIGLSSPIHMKSMKSSEFTPQTKFQSVKSEDFNSESQGLGIKSSKLPPEIKPQDMKFTELNPSSQLQGITFSKWTIGTEIQGAKSTDFNAGSLLQGVKSSAGTSETKFQDVKHKEFSPSPQEQVVKFSELLLGTKLQKVKSVDFKAGPQLQAMKPSVTMSTKLQDVKSMNFRSGPHFQGVKSSEVILRGKCQGVKSVQLKSSPKLEGEQSDLTLGRKFPDMKSVKLDSSQQLRGTKYSDLIMGIKLQDVKSVGFSSRPHFQSMKPEVIPRTKLQEKKMFFNSGPHIQSKKPESIEGTKVQDMNYLRLNHSPNLQGGKSSDLTQRRKLQGVKSVELKPVSQLQGVTSELTPESELQSGKSVEFITRPLWQDMKSFESTVGTKVQDIKSLGFNSAPQLQDGKSSVLIQGAHLQGMKSMEFNPGAKLQGAKASELTKLQIMNSTEVKDPKFQAEKPSELALESKIHSVISSEFNTGKQGQDEKSCKLNPWPEHQSVQFMVSNPGPHLQHIKSSELCQGTKLQDVKSTEFNPEQQLQDVKSSELCLRTRLQSMQPLESNAGPQLQEIKSELSTKMKLSDKQVLEVKHLPKWQGGKLSELNPGPQLQCIHFMPFNTGPQLQGVKSSELNGGPELQGIKSQVFCLGPHLQGVNSSAFISEPKLQCVNSIGCNPGLHLQGVNSSDLNLDSKLQGVKSSELTPGTEFHRETPMLFNSRPHLKSELIPESKFPGVAPMEYNTGSQRQCVNSSELNPGLTLHWVDSTGCNLGPPLQGVKCSELTPATKFPEVQVLEKHLGLEQQVGQSVLGPQLNGAKSVLFLPEPLLEDVKSMKINKEPLPCGTNSVKLISGSELQDLKCEVSALESYFQKVKSAELNPGSHPYCMNSEELPSYLRQQSGRSMVFAPEPFQNVNSFDLKPGLQSQDMNFKKLISCLSQKSEESTPEPCSQDVKSMKSDLFPQTQSVNSLGLSSCLRSQCVKSEDFAPQQHFQEVKSMELTPGSQKQDMNCRELTSGWQGVKSVVLAPEPAKKFIAGTMLTSDQFTNLSPESQQQVMKSLEFTPESKLQSIKHRKFFSASQQQPIKSVDLALGSLLQGVKSEELIPKKSYETTDSSEIILRPGHQFEEYAEMIPKPRYGVSKSVNLISMPIYEGMTSSEIAQRLAHQGTETAEKSVGLTSKSVSEAMESSGMPLELWYSQVPEFVDLTPMLRDQDSKSLELTPEKSCQVPETLKLLSQSWPQVKDRGVLYTMPLQQIVEYEGMTSEHKHHITNTVRLTSEARLPGEEFLGMTPKPISKDTRSEESSPRHYPHVPESVDLISKQCLQNVKSKKLITEPTHQILEIMELTGFQIVKTVLVPGPSLQIVKSEEIVLGPILQVVEPTGVALGLGLEVMDCLDLLPRPHLQELVEPVELTVRPNTEVKPAELTLQPISLFEDPTVLTHEQGLQAVKSIGIKIGPPEVMEPENFNLRQVYQNRESEELTSEELQIGNPFSRFLHNASHSVISSSVKTTSELEGLWDSELTEEVSRPLDIKNLWKDILQPEKSFIDSAMIQSSTFSLSLHTQPSDKTVNTVETPYSEIRGVDVISKERIQRKQVAELDNSLQDFSQHPPQNWRSSRTFQGGSGAQRGLTQSVLSRQHNVCESHSWRQRLPRKYLSNMLRLGNVLGSTMERMLCSQTPFTERATADTCQSIQNLFGIPAELMKFSQSPLEKDRGTISQPSVVRNYIQRHTSCHGYEKRMALRIWTRGSMCSIIQQYSGTRVVRIKKTDSKLSDTPQEVIQHMPVSYAGGQLPAPVKSESSFNTVYIMKDAIPVEESENTLSDSQTRSFEFQHSLRASNLSPAKTDFSEQFQLLKDLQLKIAAKLLRSQIPPNVPPPLSSGLVLKYPICLQCGRCLGFNCCHKSQATLGPYLLIYPKLHLVSTPKGRGEIRLNLGFRLRTRKKPEVPKYHRRDRPATPRSSISPSLKKAKISTRASKSPTFTIDFQSGSSQSLSPVQVHIKQKQGGSPDLVEKMDVGESGHYEFTQVHSLPESDSESNQDEKWAKMRTKKTCDSKYPMKRLPTGIRTQNRKFYTNSGTITQRPSRELPAQLRRKRSGASQTTTDFSKRQPKTSTQPRFIQLLFRGLKQTIQTAHRIMTFVGQKPEDRTKPDHLWSSENYHPKQKARDYYSLKDIKRDRLRPRDQTIKQESMLREDTGQFRSAQQLKRDRSFQLTRPIGSHRCTTCKATTITQPLGTVQSDSSRRSMKNFYRRGISSQESKNPKPRTRVQARGRIPRGSPMKRTSHKHLKERLTHKKQTHHSLCGETTPCSSSERSHRSPSERRCRSTPEKSRRRPSERRGHSLSERRPQRLSKRSPHRLSEKTQHTAPEERPRRSSPRERSRHNQSKDFKNYSNLSPRNHTKNPQSRASWEP